MKKSYKFITFSEKGTNRRELGIFEFLNLDEAELYFIENFPNEYFLSNIESLDGRSFLLTPCFEYFEEVYKTSDKEKILFMRKKEILKYLED